MNRLTSIRPLTFLKRFLRIKKVYIVCVLVSICIFLTVVLLQRLFTIRKVVINKDVYTPYTIAGVLAIRGLSNVTSTNLLLLSTEKTEKELYSNNPTLKNISIAKNYPDTLQVTASWYEPFAALEVNSGFFVVSDEGRILSKTRGKLTNLPIIHYYQKLNYGAYQSGDIVSNRDILSALRFLKLSLDLGYKTNIIDINGLSMIALETKDKKFIFTTEKDAGLQEYQMTTLIRQFKIEGTDFKQLDLRFDKPVVQMRKY